MRNVWRLLVIGGIALGLSGCSLAEEGDLVFISNPPDKFIETSFSLVRTGHFVDTSRPDAAEIIASTGNYVLDESGTPYFDYVVLSGGEIKQGSINAYTAFSPELEALLNNRSLIKPLRDKAIRVVVSVTGGGEGVSFGSLSTEGEQLIFARGLGDALRYYEIDGIELYDKDCEIPGGLSPYPALGEYYWNGDSKVFVPDEEALADAWREGGNYYANMLSYLIVSLGASTSFQGDTDPAVKETKPVLVRETGFGQRLPAAPPRFKFDSTSFYITYSVNDENNTFGAVERNLYRESYMEFMGRRQYAPVKLDLASLSNDEVADYSVRLGRSYMQETETVIDEDGEELELPKTDENGNPIITTKPNDCQYGMVYYFNLGLPDPAQTAKLSVTSKEVFGEEVVYRK